jgi:hypothetical protein
MTLHVVPDLAQASDGDAPSEQVCRIVLSRFIATTRSRELALLNAASHALELYASTTAIRNGRPRSAPRLVLPAGSHTSGLTALKRLGRPRMPFGSASACSRIAMARSQPSTPIFWRPVSRPLCGP